MLLVEAAEGEVPGGEIASTPRDERDDGLIPDPPIG